MMDGMAERSVQSVLALFMVFPFAFGDGQFLAGGEGK